MTDKKTTPISEGFASLSKSTPDWAAMSAEEIVDELRGMVQADESLFWVVRRTLPTILTAVRRDAARKILDVFAPKEDV